MNTPINITCPKCNYSEMTYEDITFDIYIPTSDIKEFKCKNKSCLCSFFAYVHCSSDRLVIFTDWNWKQSA